MKKLLALALLLIGIIATNKAQTEKSEIAEELSTKAANYLKDGNYDELHGLFSKGMSTALPLKRLEKTFSALTERFGAQEEILDFMVRETAETDYFHRGVRFKKETLDLVFTLNKENEMTSFSLRPHQPKFDWTSPDYAKGANVYVEKSIEIGDSLKLNGKMTIPDNGIETIVVFVHGSGPNDMDETLGPNKLFKDLAFGLAANGIASIRYNKRTYDYPSAMAKQAGSLTIQQVVVNDAVHALNFARKQGAKKVVLLGHSLGGYCAPMIAEIAAPDAVIVMAGNVSPLEDLLVPQYEHIQKYDTSTNINEFQMAMIRTQVERIQKNDYDEETAYPLLPLNLPPSFWLSLKDYKPQKVAKKQDFPYLILNGERDYQVTTKEAKKWKDGSKHKLSKTILYPGLNHMFFEGQGVCIPAEYEIKSHASKEVLNDIINWIGEI